ncbi:hypothetical protein Tco_1367448 [Tanacetum coccineum]
MQFAKARSGFDVFEKGRESVELFMSCKVRVGSNGNLLWEASVLYDEKKGCVMDTLKFTAMPFGLTNAPAVFMELMSRSKEEYESHVKMIVESLKEEEEVLKFSNQRERSIRGSYLDLEESMMLYRGVGRRSEAKNEFEIDVRRSDLVLMPQVVKSRDEIFSRWGYCDNHDLSRIENFVLGDWSESKEEYESHVKMIMESLKEDKMYVKFSNNVEAEQKGSYLDVKGIKWHAWKREKVIAYTVCDTEVSLMKDCLANV